MMYKIVHVYNKTKDEGQNHNYPIIELVGG